MFVSINANPTMYIDKAKMEDVNTSFIFLEKNFSYDERRLKTTAMINNER